MPVIEKGAPVLTVVVAIEVEPERQRAFLDRVGRMIEDFTRHQPGLVSTSIHASEDGTRILNYAQWRSREDYERFRKNPEGKPHVEALMAIATSMESHVMRPEIVATGPE